MNGTRALFRIAWRESRRHKRRSALVIALVAFPVAVAAGVLTGRATIVPTGDEQRRLNFGSADLAVSTDLPRPAGEVELSLLSQLPSGSHVVPMTESWAEDLVIGDRAPADVRTLQTDPGDSVNRGRFRFMAGRLPRTSSEVTLSPALAEDVEAQVGDAIELYPGDRSRTVVGIVRERAHLQGQLLIMLPNADDTTGWMVDLPSGSNAEEVARHLRLPARVDTVESRLVPAPNATNQAAEYSAAYAIGVFVFIWTGVVAAAALSIGARRQLREIGLVAANGGNKRQVRRLLLANAVVLGFVGSVIGAMTGIAASRIALSQLEHTWLLESEAGDLRVPVVAVVGTVALGVVCAAAAGLRPAVRAERIPATAALQGRMPRPPRHVRSVVAGTMLGTIGVVLIGVGARVPAPRADVSGTPTNVKANVLIASGTVLVVLAAALLNRLVLAVVARLSGHAGLSLRFASRDANRNSQRTGPAVVASMLALAGTVGALTLLATYDSKDRESLGASGQDEQLVASLSVSAALNQPLGDLQQLDQDLEQSVAGAVPGADAAVARTPEELSISGAVWVSGETGQQGLGMTEHRYLRVNLPSSPDDRDAQKVRAALLRQLDAASGVEASSLYVRTPERAQYSGLVAGSIALGVGVSLVVLALMAALSRAETHAEVQTLHALGISPRRRRRLAASSAGVLAVVASALAVPAGLVPSLAYLHARYAVSGDATSALVIPWSMILAVVAAVTIVLMAGGWLAAGRHSRRSDSGDGVITT